MFSAWKTLESLVIDANMATINFYYFWPMVNRLNSLRHFALISFNQRVDLTMLPQLESLYLDPDRRQGKGVVSLITSTIT